MIPMKFKYSLIITLILASGFTFNLNAQSKMVTEINLLAGWDGYGKTGAGSEPNNFGWACTVINSTGWTQSGSGSVRFMDNAWDYAPGRMLFVRWDGSGGTTGASIYSFPVELEASKTYEYKIKFAHHSNSKTDFILGINSKADNTGLSLVKATLSPNTQSFKEAAFQVSAPETGKYYITIASNASGMLGSIQGLTLFEIPSVLHLSDTIANLNYFNESKTFTVYPNGSNDSIYVSTTFPAKVSAKVLSSTGGEFSVSSDNYQSGLVHIGVYQGLDSVKLRVSLNFPEGFLPEKRVDTLTTNGAWCWFADPRSLYYKGEKEQTYFSWITTEGDIVVASYNHVTGEYLQKTVWANWQSDDHDNPSLLIRDDGRIIVFFAKHFGPPIKRMITTNPEDITSWGSDYELGNNVTYPYPFRIDKTVYVLYRGEASWHPHLVVSTDNGQTFGAPKEFISGGGQRPYTRYAQGTDGSIHVAVTTGHPRNEPANKIYYCRFKDNVFYRANGTVIKDFADGAVDISQLEVVYDARVGKGWIWDIALEPVTGYPIMVYASFPTNDDHRYHYARWDGTKWNNIQITEAGKWFPQTPSGVDEYENNYSGGLILDYDDPTTVYLSKQVKGVFELFKYKTADFGASWDIKAITWNTPSHLVNVRPIVPRHHKKGFFDVIWMKGEYVFYANQQYHTSLVYTAADSAFEMQSLEIDPGNIELSKGESQQLHVRYTPFLVNDRSLFWTSSDTSVVKVNNGKVSAVGIGNAIVSVEAKNGVKAQTMVSVKERLLLSSAFFDFGTSTSSVVEGAIQISDLHLLKGAYGWVSAPLTRNRTSGTDSELADFNMSATPMVFKVYVNNGLYTITVKQGDYDYAHDHMVLKVNGSVRLADVTSAIGQFQVNKFELDVVDNLLEFEFSDGGGSDANWVVNSLDIESLNTEILGVTDVNTSESRFAVYDFTGKLIQSFNTNSRDFNQLIARLNVHPGFYLIRIANSQSNQIRKVVIK